MNKREPCVPMSGCSQELRDNGKGTTDADLEILEKKIKILEEENQVLNDQKVFVRYLHFEHTPFRSEAGYIRIRLIYVGK